MAVRPSASQKANRAGSLPIAGRVPLHSAQVLPAKRPTTRPETGYATTLGHSGQPLGTTFQSRVEQPT